MSETTARPVPQAKYRADYAVPAFLVDSLDLRFELDEKATTVAATLALRRNPAAEDVHAPLVLDGEGLELLSIALDGRKLTETRYALYPEGLTIEGLPDAFTLRTEVRIRPRANKAFEGLFMAGSTFCTQCEAEGFRRITYYPDRPDVMTTWTVTVVADARRCPVLLSNGNLVEEGALDGGRHFARYADPFKKPSYLFALVAGDLRCHAGTFTTASGRTVELGIYVEPENVDKCEHALRSLRKAMKWDEQVFGLECDLDQYKIVAVNDFNMGAMENKGLNVFNSKFVLARPETASDDDYEAIEGVVAHEYFHNWTGNRVTCRDWFQLSLKEGLTVFRDQQFSADMTSRAVKRISDVRVLRTHQFAEDAGPMAHPVRPESYIEMNNFYTVTVYNKGAEVVRMMHTLLGAEGFRRGMDLYFERHDGQAVTCDDFRAALADANGVDLEQFERWYLQAGTPRIAVSGAYDARARTYTLTLRQSTPPTPGQEEKLSFHVPVAVGLLDPRGADVPLRLAGEERAGPATRVLELRGEEASFTFVDVPERPVPSLMRGFSAPVVVECEHSAADLAFLAAHDGDPFNRWDAGEKHALRTLLGLVADLQAGRPLALDGDFVRAFRATLGDGRLDRSLKALALVLPDEPWLAEQMETADPEAVHAARNFARAALAAALRDELLDGYRENAQEGPYRIDQESIGARRLKNVCLAYLTAHRAEDFVPLCAEQFRAADNMTDQIAALGLLCHIDRPEREEALAAFHERWKRDPLVIDKWFSVQALSDLPDVLPRVERLMEHPDFTLENPNRARALVGAFGTGNFAHFHAASGAGYAFLAERVLELDAQNPQVASRLLTPLLRWRRYDAGRGGHMKAQLERLMAAPKLSKDVYEKVARSLEPVT